MSNASTPEPLDPNFQLKLPTFEGPLDLLLHLTQKHELDILDLPIAFVTERYVEYIRLMERLNLDVAAEYLVMAATLAHIKSKMLLPPDPTAVDDEAEAVEELDPRAELIRRLLEYQKYKHAGEMLGSRGVQGRDVFPRGMDAPEAMGPAPLAGLGLFKLLDAFQAVLKRAKQDLAFEITSEGVSIQDRMSQLAERLAQRKRCTFDELFDDVKTVYEVVVTFLALLEMAKRRLARVYQSEPTAPIHLEYRVLDASGEDEPELSPDLGPVESGIADASPTEAPPVPEEVTARAEPAGAPETEVPDPSHAEGDEEDTVLPPPDDDGDFEPDAITEAPPGFEGADVEGADADTIAPPPDTHRPPSEAPAAEDELPVEEERTALDPGGADTHDADPLRPSPPGSETDDDDS